MRALLLALCLTACSSAPPATSSTSSSSGATPAPPATKPEPVEKAGPSHGEPCGTDGHCGSGLECVSYFGIAGAKGPQFKTCEQRCADDAVCTGGRHCATIADGPGRVCR